MRREDSIFEINPAARERVKKGIDKDGSNLTVVSCVCSWKEPDMPMSEGWDQIPQPLTKVEDHTIDKELAPIQLISGGDVKMNQEAGNLLGLALRYLSLCYSHFGLGLRFVYSILRQFFTSSRSKHFMGCLGDFVLFQLLLLQYICAH